MTRYAFEKLFYTGNKLLHCIAIFCLLLLFSCKKKSNNGPTLAWDGNLVAYSPVPVTKTVTKKVFVHFMPWFETPITSNNSSWGEHWTMTNQVPPVQVASYYYPLNTLYFTNGAYRSGPYGTSDTLVIDYQLLLMKLSGIDGIFIDWPGTINYSDYLKNVANANVVISRLAKVGLKYAVVYEDQNLQFATPSTQAAQIAAAKADMNYIQTNYFTDTATTYETFNGKPLLLDFGPFGPLSTSAEWDSVFSVFTTHPSFFPYEYQTNKGGADVAGEFAWVQQSNLTNLNNFYAYSYPGAKIAAAYPGFNSFYAAGGEPDPTPWTIAYGSGSTSTFSTTLSLAINQPGNYIQLETWNDYGEGTMIEPTTQYQYSFLTTLQQQLGVQSLSESDLQAVAKLYRVRANNILPNYNSTNLEELDQVYYYMASLQMDSAKALLNNF
jgi:hypothetical protein